MDVKAIHTGDTKRFHRFEIVDDFEGMVGTIYQVKSPDRVKLTSTVVVSFVFALEPEYSSLKDKLDARKGGF